MLTAHRSLLSALCPLQPQLSTDSTDFHRRVGACVPNHTCPTQAGISNINSQISIHKFYPERSRRTQISSTIHFSLFTFHLSLFTFHFSLFTSSRSVRGQGVFFNLLPCADGDRFPYCFIYKDFAPKGAEPGFQGQISNLKPQFTNFTLSAAEGHKFQIQSSVSMLIAHRSLPSGGSQAKNDVSTSVFAGNVTVT